MKKYLIILLCLVVATNSYAQESKYIEVVKEYFYNTSDDDSKNSARAKALEQVKIMALEDVGIYVESYLEVNTNSDDIDKQYVREQIKTLAAGIVQADVLEESYDGEIFYIKAKVTVDKESVEKSIEKAVEINNNERKIIMLENQTNSLTNELNEVRKLKSERSFFNAIKSKSDVLYVSAHVAFPSGQKVKRDGLEFYNDDNYRSGIGLGTGATLGYWVPHAKSALEFSYQYNWLYSGNFKSSTPRSGSLEGYNTHIHYLLTIPVSTSLGGYLYFGGGLAFSSYEAKTEYVDKAGKITVDRQTLNDFGPSLKGGLRFAFKRTLIDFEINGVLNDVRTYHYIFKLGMMF